VGSTCAEGANSGRCTASRTHRDDVVRRGGHQGHVELVEEPAAKGQAGAVGRVLPVLVILLDGVAHQQQLLLQALGLRQQHLRVALELGAGRWLVGVGGGGGRAAVVREQGRSPVRHRRELAARCLVQLRLRFLGAGGGRLGRCHHGRGGLLILRCCRRCSGTPVRVWRLHRRRVGAFVIFALSTRLRQPFALGGAGVRRLVPLAQVPDRAPDGRDQQADEEAFDEQDREHLRGRQAELLGGGGHA